MAIKTKEIESKSKPNNNNVHSIFRTNHIVNLFHERLLFSTLNICILKFCLQLFFIINKSLAINNNSNNKICYCIFVIFESEISVVLLELVDAT